MGYIAQVMILGRVKVAIVRTMTLPANKGLGGASGSVIGKTKSFSLAIMPEVWAASRGTAPSPPAPQPFPPVPLVVPIPTNSFEGQGVKLQSASITKLRELCKA